MTPLAESLLRFLPANRVVTDELRKIAYGTDASFYRLTPEIVVFAESEDEVRRIVHTARSAGHSVTFRAAGTSLSGQAVGDGVLVVLGDGFKTLQILDAGARIALGPAVVGADANRVLAPLGRKIGPDPASINACKIGGIAANNASGMCCGTSQNSYRTLASMRLMLADGAVVDTADAASVAGFRASHGALLDSLAQLATEVRANPILAGRIAKKFKIKNTTGYSLNALIDFTDPLDILIHLLIGSEGTLGFISRVDYNTVPEQADKASALVFFPDIATACHAVIRLKTEAVSAVEIMDRAALHSVQGKPGMPEALASLPETAAALLIETRADNAALLGAQIAHLETALAGFSVIGDVHFYTDAPSGDKLWKIRKGMFPSVGAMRATGTTVIIEDIAFPIEHLAAGTLDLQALFAKHHYTEAIIFGHALEGNLHFVFTQDFEHQAEVDRYARFMDDVCHLVIDKYDGSLKAEHGTGRNMAPFVELEWGKDATALMWAIKRLLDPDAILNPGVVLDTDPEAHLKHLKPLPAADDGVDKCIECGFCEPMCPSAGLTFSPRQRIVSTREMARRRAAGESSAPLVATYDYFGKDTCAGCGLCSTVCPVGIDTGALIRRQRHDTAGSVARQLGRLAANHFAATAALSRWSLNAGRLTAAVIGDATLGKLSAGAWKPGLQGASGPKVQTSSSHNTDRAVYFAGCAGRIFGSGNGSEALSDVVVRVLQRSGFAPILPKETAGLCCGQPFESKGLFDTARAKADELAAALIDASENGRLPVVFDASPCALRMKNHLAGRLPILDFAEFAHDTLLPRLSIKTRRQQIALHLNCSGRRMGHEAKLNALARACADSVIAPAEVKCCGFGGDRGFAVPELNTHALRDLPDLLPTGCQEGYSTNRTCEIGLTAHTGVEYRSIACLLDECTR